MLYPITLLLWAVFFPAQPLTQPTPAQPHFSSVVVGDSSVFKILAARLERRGDETRPEKLYLHLDRTLFQPGETLWFNAYLRNAGDLLPAKASEILYVELLSPQQVVLMKKTILAENGTAAGEFDFADNLPGGLYKIKAYTNWMRNTGAVFERTITLQKTVLPNLNLRLQFERKAFGPGDVVVARLDAAGLDNKPLAERVLRVSAHVSGQNCHSSEARTDVSGRAYIRFSLPTNLASTDGLLNIQLEHEGQQEAISRAIPIVLNRIDLKFFPEGGDLAAGLPSRVAFKAVNEFGKPADVQGQVLDASGDVVAQFESFHDGMGAFDFVPQAGVLYTARLQKPVEMPAPYYLPAVQTEGCRLHIEKQTNDALHVSVAATRPGKVILVASARDALFFFKEMTLPQQTTVRIPVADLPPGIVRVTLFDAATVEQAERLAFVNRDRGLQIEIKPDREQYLPRDKVRLDIRVRDQAGRPVKGAFSLAVSDEKLLTYADDKQGHLLAALLLEQDVQGKIEEPNFYFDKAEQKSASALDYLLMTQGWRRFAWREVLEAPALKYAHAAERAVVEGVLLKANGKPFADATVTLYPNGPSQKADRDGRFLFERPDLNRYTAILYNDNQLHRLRNYQQGIVLRGGGYVGSGVVVEHKTPNATNGSVLTGHLTDDMGEALIGGTIKILRSGELVRGTITDYNGDFRVAIEPGTYQLEFSYTGYRALRTGDIRVETNTMQTVEAALHSGIVLEEVAISAYKVPLIQQDNTQGGQTLTSSEIRNLPTRSVNALVATTAGTTSIEGGSVNIRGTRSNVTNYYIDGIRMSGPMPPVQDLEVKEFVGNGLPAEYGTKADRDERLEKKKMVEAPRRTHVPAERFTRARVFYVPQYGSQEQPKERTDFRFTIYWNSAVRTDGEGRAQVEFFASDAVTNFRATLEGIADAGIAARAEHKFFVQKPLSIALKTPSSVIAGDVLRLQIALSNKSDVPVEEALALEAPTHFSMKNELPKTVRLAAGETRVLAAEYAIGQPEKTELLPFRVRFGEADAYETAIVTQHRGFPVRQVFAGKGAQNLFDLHLADPVEGTVSVKLTAYGSALDDVLKGMERMLRQPSGCFEQVSSSNYPNLLVLDLLRQSGAARPEVEAKALQLLEDGYKKLAAYECKDGGFDWWGRSPAHEGLTAYGILQFGDMARVFPGVDKGMTERSVRWLLERRDGSGGWKRRADWHGWQSEGVIGAYIAWAVSEAGFGDQFEPEISSAFLAAKSSGDPYQLALVANALLAKKDPRGKEALRLLLEKKDEKGAWTGKSHSVMGSGGNCLRIEATALAALAMMKSGERNPALIKAMEFIAAAKNEYGYGSTQSTVLALKALVEYAKLNNQTVATDGQLVVLVDGKRVAEQEFSGKNPRTFEIKNLEKHLTGDRSRVEIFFENTEAVLPFDVEVQYASRQPNSTNGGCPFAFSTHLSEAQVGVGGTVRLSAVLQNTSKEQLASPMVVLGIPAGLSLQPWQLKQLVDEKQCDFYELWDGFAVFHFEGLPAGESRRIDLDMRADISGAFEAPAAQAFLYYENDKRIWSKPERVVVE
ncbi:MAG: carboxypeptidase regulatory-like domain-containing protein [Saprospiraceae bacterium]